MLGKWGQYNHLRTHPIYKPLNNNSITLNNLACRLFLIYTSRLIWIVLIRYLYTAPRLFERNLTEDHYNHANTDESPIIFACNYVCAAIPSVWDWVNRLSMNFTCFILCFRSNIWLIKKTWQEASFFIYCRSELKFECRLNSIIEYFISI